MLEKIVVLLQQSVPPIYATCVSKKYSMKLRLLSRTWPNISKLERAVLILRPSMFIAAVVKRLVPASLNAWRHQTASVQKGADGWRWPKPKKTLETKKKQKKQQQLNNIIFRESWLGPAPLPKSLELFFFCVFFGMLSAFVASAACMWQYLQNFLFTCIVGLPETHVQVQVGPRQDYTCIRNWLPKFLTWDSKCLEWPCMWWVEADHCYVHVRLI